MAQPELRLPQNVPGDFYVDSTCIDCDTCRFVAADVFARSEGAGMSYVRVQPPDEGHKRAMMALVACPTASIGSVGSGDAREAAGLFPENLEAEVSYCGYASEKSFGASSYFVERSDGNLLIDSPRAAGPLLKSLAERGGVRRMLLSHRDDVADHARYHERFGCERVLHATEIGRSTRDVEVQLEITEPTPVGGEIIAIPTPGHTEGHLVYLYRDRFLFSGDHLWWSPNVGGLHASRRHCWWNWPKQIESMEALLDFSFEWVLPGHGRRWQAPSSSAMRREIEALIGCMKAARA